MRTLHRQHQTKPPVIVCSYQNVFECKTLTYLVFFQRVVFQPLCPSAIALQGLVVVTVQYLALCLTEPHGPLIQPVQVLLQSLLPSRWIAQSNLVFSMNLLMVHSVPSSRLKKINRTGPNTGDAAPLTYTLRAHLLTHQSAHILVMGCQLFQENAVRDRVRVFVKIQTDNTHRLFLILQVSHPVAKADQVGETGPAFAGWT